MRSVKKLFYLFLFVAMNLCGANDADFDGVDDICDKCPNTSFSDLVDARGCSVSSLFVPVYYDLIIGYDYSSSNTKTLEDITTINTTIQADISRENLSLQLLSSYYKSSGSGMHDKGWNDTQLSLFYLLKPMPLLKIQAGVGVILPTYATGYNNEATDYIASFSLEYSLKEEINIFGGYSYTIVNDDNVGRIVEYQNSNRFYAGLLHVSSKKVSLSLSYSNSQSIYAGVDRIETLACGAIISLSPHWFTLMDYRYGLSESASKHEVAMRLGYAF